MLLRTISTILFCIPFVVCEHSEVWFGYIRNSGVGNREALNVSAVRHVGTVNTQSHVTDWYQTPVQGKLNVLGVADHEVIQLQCDDKGLSTISVTDLVNSVIDTVVFTKWNTTTNHLDSFAIFATETPQEFILNWFRLTESSLELLQEWPLHRHINKIEVLNLFGEPKLLILSQSLDKKTPSADLYNFALDGGLDLWLLDRFLLPGVPSSAALTQDGEEFYLSLAFPFLGTIQLYGYNQDGHFTPPQQHISHVGVTLLTPFQVGFQSYLAVAGSAAAIYRFQDSKLLLANTHHLNIEFVKHWLPVPVHTYRGDVVLFAEGAHSIAVVKNTGREDFEMVTADFPSLCTDAKGVRCQVDVTLKGGVVFYKDTPKVLLPSTSGPADLFDVISALVPLPSTIDAQLKALLERQAALKERVMQQQRKYKAIDKTKIAVLRALRVKEVFAETVVLMNTTADHVEVAGMYWTDQDGHVSSSSLVDLSASVSDGIHNIMVKWQELMKSQEDVLPPHFTGDLVVEGGLLAHSITAGSINGHEVDSVLKDTFRCSNTENITGVKSFESLSAETLQVARVGSYDACDMMYSDPEENTSENVIQGDLAFEQKVIVAEDVRLLNGGRVNGMALDKDLFHLKLPYSNDFTFTDLAVTRETTLQAFGSLPLVLPLRNPPVHVDSLNHVPQAIVDAVYVDNDINVDFVNGKNFTEFKQRLDRLGNDSSLHLAQVLIASDLTVEYLNGVKFPEDFVLSSSSAPVHITGTKTFIGELVVGDLVTLSDDEPSQLSKQAEADEDQAVYVLDDLHVDGIVVADQVNQWTWPMLDDVVLKKDTNVVLQGVKHFPHGFTTASVQLSTFNNLTMDQLLTADTPQTFSLPQVLTNATFNHVDVSGLWDGANVSRLHDLARLSSNNTFAGRLVVNGSEGVCLRASMLHVNTLNGFIYPDMLLNKTADMSSVVGNVSCAALHVEQLITNGSVLAAENINGFNLTALNGDRLSRTQAQTISADLAQPLQQDLTLHGNITSSTISSSRMDSATPPRGASLAAMLQAGEMTRLNSIRVMGSVHTQEGVSGIDLRQIQKRAFRLAHPMVFTGQVDMVNPPRFQQINVTGTVDSVDLYALAKDVVLRNSGAVYMSGTKNFANGIQVEKNLNVKTLNGRPVNTILMKHGYFLMNGGVVVNGSVRVLEHMNLYGGWNKHDLSRLHERFSTTYNSFFVSGDARLSGAVQANSLISHGRINNVDFDQLVLNAVRRHQDVQLGNVTFAAHVHMTQDLQVQETVNNYNFSALYKDMVLVNRAANISGHLTAASSTMTTLRVRHNLTAAFIDGCNLQGLLEDSIPLNGDVFVRGEKTFTRLQSRDDVRTDLLNDRTLESVIRLQGAERYPVPICLHHVTSLSNIPVDGSVNEKNLLAEFDDTVMVSGGQYVRSIKKYTGNVTIRGSLSVNSINHIPVQDMVTLDTAQTLSAPLIFSGSVLARQHIRNVNLINNIDLRDWSTRQLYLTKPANVTGTWTVLGNVTMKRKVSGGGLLNNMAVTSANDSWKTKTAEAVWVQQQYADEYLQQCSALQNLSKTAAQQVSMLRHFQATQDLDLPAGVESVITYQVHRHSYLLVSFLDQCESMLYRWSSDTSRYQYLHPLNLGRVSVWGVIETDTVTFVVTSSRRHEQARLDCFGDEQEGNVWTFTHGDEEKYGHLLGMGGFTQVLVDQTTLTMYTLGRNGSLFEMVFSSDLSVRTKTLAKISIDNARFVPLELGLGLAVTDGVTMYKVDDSASLDTSQLPAAWMSRLPGSQGDMAVSSAGATVLTAVARSKHFVDVYQDIVSASHVYSRLPSHNPGSLVWISFGPGREAFLLFTVDNLSIDVHQYRGVSGLKKRTTLRIPAEKLHKVELPGKSSSRNIFLLVVQKKRIRILETVVTGSIYHDTATVC